MENINQYQDLLKYYSYNIYEAITNYQRDIWEDIIYCFSKKPQKEAYISEMEALITYHGNRIDDIVYNFINEFIDITKNITKNNSFNAEYFTSTIKAKINDVISRHKTALWEILFNFIDEITTKSNNETDIDNILNETGEKVLATMKKYEQNILDIFNDAMKYGVGE